VALRAIVWGLIGAAVVLGSRAIVYAAAPTQATLVDELEHRGGGARIAVLVAAVPVIGAGLAAAVLWFAVVAVKERLAVEWRAVVAPPRLRPSGLAFRALVLFAATVPAFAYFESYLHWRAGLGWHGLGCVLGPVHRDAIPVLGALSVLAVAVHGALEHLLAWARRLVAALAARLPRIAGARPSAFRLDAPGLRRVLAAADPRGPPPAVRLRHLT
jgi:hypothetical protein